MRKLLLVGSALAFGWAAAVYASGGIAWQIAGVWFRSRDPLRPLIVGLALFIVQAIIFRQAFARDVNRATAAARSFASAGAVVAAVTLALVGVRFGTFTAGSADSYGYVSQAYRWASGELPRASPLPLSLPWPSADFLQSPLGYRPGPHPHTMVPTYAPGLSLVMAAALVLGACGPFLVVPAFGALFVWLTFVWGRRAAGPLAGAIAAAFILTSPIVIFQVLWPMSDIPAGALWTGAAIAALNATRISALGTGLLAAAGLLVRPNLPLVVLVPIAQVALGGAGRERWIRTALAVAPVALGALFVAVLNAMWYGAPWNTGYGGAGELYSLGNVWPNLVRYPVWLWQSQSGWVLLALVPLLPWFRTRVEPTPVRLAYLLIGATALSYVAYAPFDDWSYLRFMMPAMGAIAVLMAVGTVAIGRRLPGQWGRAVAVAIVFFVMVHTTSFSRGRGMFGALRAGERRYVDAGAFIARSLPDNALVLSMQHSGSVRFYGGRLSIRYDLLDGEFVQNGPAELERAGYHPYLAIDDWEAPYVRKQFQLPADTPLPWRLIARLESYGVSVFDMAANPKPAPPVALESGSTPLCVPPQPLLLRRHE